MSDKLTAPSCSFLFKWTLGLIAGGVGFPFPLLALIAVDSLVRLRLSHFTRKST